MMAETFHRAVAEFKRRLIAHALAGTAGNVTQAAKQLGLQRSYLSRLRKQFRVPVIREGRR